MTMLKSCSVSFHTRNPVGRILPRSAELLFPLFGLMSRYRDMFGLSLEFKTKLHEIYILPFEMRCYQMLLNISYKDHVTNKKVRRKQPLENMTNSWPWSRNGNWGGLTTSQGQRKLRWFDHISRSEQRQFYWTQWKEKEKIDRRRREKTILRSEQGWTSLAQLGQLKTDVKSSIVPQRPRNVMGYATLDYSK